MVFMTEPVAAPTSANPPHTDGAGCPACPDFATWNQHHCYSCGGALLPRAADLLARFDELTEPEREDLNRLTVMHAACFA